jgi:hypothetical protein
MMDMDGMAERCMDAMGSMMGGGMMGGMVLFVVLLVLLVWVIGLVAVAPWSSGASESSPARVKPADKWPRVGVI